MSVQLLYLLFGGGLFLIAILGGGFEMRELKMAKVGTVARVLAAIFGVLFLLLGVGTDEG
jgi:hypothetical protein